MKSNLILSIGLITFGVLSRTIFHLAPNLEFITAISIVSGYIFHNHKYLRFFIPIITMLLSDLIIGNQLIYLFTWTGFLCMPLLGAIIKRLEHMNIVSNILLKQILLSEGAGIIATIFFFLWTNLGVVLVTNMYEKNIYGLMESYAMGLEFLRIQLAGNIIFVPLMVVGYSLIKNLILKVDFKRINYTF